METLSVSPARLRQHRAFLRTASVTNAQDASGSHSFSYGHFGNTDTESQQIASETYALTEHWDSFGRSTGYSLRKDGSDLSRATTSYGTLGRIGKVGFAHDGKELAFRYNYLDGSNLLQTLTMPNGVTLTQSYEEKRDLLTGMDYVRGNSLITKRQYSYDKIGRPVTRGTNYPGRDIQHSDSFIYNRRSELTGALLGDASYTYAYDNIGNREIAQEAATDITYDANELNQYMRITTDGENFTPEFDADGNQTLVQTSSGIWRVTYNAQNRAVKFVSGDGKIVITCAYDYMGRRFEKKVVKDGTTTLHERYIYRSYLQIAALDLLHDSALIHTILWDATQPIATRPLAICMGGTYYTYGWDLTKNVTEIFSLSARLQVDYVYTPFGQVREDGIIPQPIQWSSEMYDAETWLVYYNYRYYNPRDGRWTRRDDMDSRNYYNFYLFSNNSPLPNMDILGLDVYVRDTEASCGWHRKICVTNWTPVESTKGLKKEDTCCYNRKKYRRGKNGFCVGYGPESWYYMYAWMWSPFHPRTQERQDPLPDGMRRGHARNGIVKLNDKTEREAYNETSDKPPDGLPDIATNCRQDIKVKEYLSNQVGLRGPYNATGARSNCRAYAYFAYQEIKKLLKNIR